MFTARDEVPPSTTVFFWVCLRDGHEASGPIGFLGTGRFLANKLVASTGTQRSPLLASSSIVASAGRVEKEGGLLDCVAILVTLTIFDRSIWHSELAKSTGIGSRNRGIMRRKARRHTKH